MRKLNLSLHLAIDFSCLFAKAFYFHERYERAHISFGMEDGMDRIVVTKPSERLPKLGGVLSEDAESIKTRKKIGPGSVNWNLEDTYTMAFWSAYVHYIDVRLPLRSTGASHLFDDSCHRSYIYASV